MTIQGQYRGFLLEARRWDGTNRDPVGTFTNYPSGVRAIACLGTDDTLTHSSSNPKSDIKVQWVPPNQEVGNIVFVATVVQSKDIYWVDIYSKTVTGQRYRGRDLQSLKYNSVHKVLCLKYYSNLTVFLNFLRIIKNNKAL